MPEMTVFWPMSMPIANVGDTVRTARCRGTLSPHYRGSLSHFMGSSHGACRSAGGGFRLRRADGRMWDTKRPWASAHQANRIEVAGQAARAFLGMARLVGLAEPE